jgi:hypothetical protein
VEVFSSVAYRDKKVVGVFVRFRAPLRAGSVGQESVFYMGALWIRILKETNKMHLAFLFL